MPNSLKCRLKKLAYQGLLSEKDLSRIYTDNDMISELEKIKVKIDKEVAYSNKWQVKNDSIKIIDEKISELKGE